MKTLENLNLYPYAIEVELNGVTHNVLPTLDLCRSSFYIDIQSLIPQDVVPLSSELFSKNKCVIDEQGNLNLTEVDVVGIEACFYNSSATLNIIPMGHNDAVKLINFYQKMVGNKLVITLTPKQYLDLFTFDIAYEIVPK